MVTRRKNGVRQGGEAEIKKGFYRMNTIFLCKAIPAAIHFPGTESYTITKNRAAETSVAPSGFSRLEKRPGEKVGLFFGSRAPEQFQGILSGAHLRAFLLG